jgi:hypothetical protein
LSVDAKFVFLLDDYREKYLSQFRLCLHSLRTRGGRARDTECVLVYLGEVEPRIERFCQEHGVTLRPETPIDADHPHRNKPLMLGVEPAEVVAVLDLDLLFAGDPTPALEQCAREARVCVRPAGKSPILEGAGEGGPAPLRRLQHWRGRREWRALFTRHAPGRPAPAEVSSQRGDQMLPNYNIGVVLVPGRAVASLRARWQQVVEDLNAIEARDGFLANYLDFRHADQIAFGVALHALDIEPATLDHRYHFQGMHTEDPENRALLRRGEVAIIHYTGRFKQYMRPKHQGPVPAHHAEVYALVREILGEAGVPAAAGEEDRPSGRGRRRRRRADE